MFFSVLEFINQCLQVVVVVVVVVGFCVCLLFWGVRFHDCTTVNYYQISLLFPLVMGQVIKYEKWHMKKCIIIIIIIIIIMVVVLVISRGTWPCYLGSFGFTELLLERTDTGSLLLKKNNLTNSLCFVIQGPLSLSLSLSLSLPLSLSYLVIGDSSFPAVEFFYQIR